MVNPDDLELIARNRQDMMGYMAPELEEMTEWKVAQEIRAADKALVDWANEVGWGTGHGDTLADMINEMRRQHQEESHAAQIPGDPPLV